LKIILEEGAFLTIIAAVAEVYKKECYGLLVGRKRGKTLRVTAAIVAQKVTRTHKLVSLRRSHFTDLLKIVEVLPSCELLGEFHSHPQYGINKGSSYPSKYDINDGSGLWQIIISANDVQRKQAPFKINKDGSISGVINHISMAIRAFRATWRYHKSNDSVERDANKIPIECKFLEK